MSLRTALLVLSWLVVSAVRADVDATTEELSLAVGESRTLSAEDVKSYSVGTPGIVDIKVTPNGTQFVIAGQKPGSTSLLLIKRNQEVTWNINVFTRPVQVVQAELSELLGDTTGIRVRRVGSRFFIEGGVSAEAELKRIEHVAKLYEGQVESLVVLGGAAADRKINIRVDFFFVQYNKNKTMQAGIGWPAAIGGQNIVSSNLAYNFLGGGAFSAANAAVVNQPLPKLDMAARNGWAKVMRHSTVITSNGNEAEFANGGTQNFAVANGLTATIHKITFGTTVKVLPRFDPTSREIQVTVNADIADLTPPTTSATTLPGQNTAKLSTAVALKLGQSVVLSGVHVESRRYNTSGIPYLSQIPIIGWLFGSIGDEGEDIEGAIFVIPSVIESAPQRALELVDRALGQFEKFDGDMREVSPFDEAPPLVKQATP